MNFDACKYCWKIPSAAFEYPNPESSVLVESLPKFT